MIPGLWDLIAAELQTSRKRQFGILLNIVDLTKSANDLKDSENRREDVRGRDFAQEIH
jgi:hypothetical protein